MAGHNRRAAGASGQGNAAALAPDPAAPPAQGWEAHLAGARAACAAGQWARAIRLLEAAGRLAEPGTRAEALCLVNLLNVQFRYGSYRGALATAGRLLSGPAAWAEFHPQVYLTRANTWWMLGAAAAAATDFRQAVAAAAPGSAAAVRALLNWAQFAAEHGDVAGAMELLERIPVTAEAEPAFLGTATAAAVAWAAGQPEAARRLVAQARRLAAALPGDAHREVDLAMLQYLEGCCAAAAGDRGTARETGLLAAGSFRRLGHGRLWERAMGLVQACRPGREGG